MNIKDLSTAELQKELERRGMIKNNVPKPFPIEKVNWDIVYNQAVDMVNRKAKDQFYEDDDDIRYLYESVLQAIFTETIWDWMNNKF